MQEWLELDRIEVNQRGDLAAMLHGGMKHGAASRKKQFTS
jgi:hypothetical protein